MHTRDPSILYQGLLRSPASWARVGRGYLAGLRQLGHPVSAVQVRGFRYDPSFPIPEGIDEISPESARAMPEPDIGLGFVHPPHLDRLVGNLRTNFFVWESDRIPRPWVSHLTGRAHLVIVPSAFSRHALETSGYPRDRIVLAPYGHDVSPGPSHRSQRSNGRPFCFLAVMSPHHRKGVVELLKAYARAFSSHDDVVLTIKTTYDPGAAKRRFPFEILSWASALRDAGLLESNAPRYRLEIATLSDDETLALYRESDVYVNPSWGEAFGLAILEAMASGLPVIATAWSGHLDFCLPGEDLVPYELTRNPEALYEPHTDGQLAIPNIEALSSRMRWHFDHRDASRTLGERCRAAAASMPWKQAAETLLTRLDLAAQSRTE